MDERERLFQMRGTKVTIGVVSGGFIVSVAALAYGWQALTVSPTLELTFRIASVLGKPLEVMFQYGDNAR